MTADRAIRAALAAAGRCDRIASCVRLGGGCIHTVMRVDLEDGATVAAKVNQSSSKSMFEAESIGLQALTATGTVCVPQPIGVAVAQDAAAFIMQWLEPAAATSEAWAHFGEDLASLHQSDSGRRYGFAADNHIGSTPQSNDWCDDWVQFNAEHRLGRQLALGRNAALLDERDARVIEGVISRLDQFIPHHPHPALLHGDLWSGNALPTRVNDAVRVAVIDPACSIGDGWADVAMMKLFGGFPSSCFDAYAAAMTDHDALDARIAVYQLYHVLNHINIFGRGYLGQAMALCRQLV